MLAVQEQEQKEQLHAPGYGPRLSQNQCSHVHARTSFRKESGVSVGLCHSCLSEDDGGGSGLTPVGPTPAATAAWAASPCRGCGVEDFPRLTGVACAVVAACLFSVIV